MKTPILAVLLMAFVSFVGFTTNKSQPAHKYVGAEVCGMCHRIPKSGEQFQKWQASRHSQAMKVLTTPAALKIAKARGVRGSPDQSPECLKCHQTAYDVPATMLGPRFNKEDGVQCETCHGPGSDYMKMNIMKNVKEVEANGLTVLSVTNGSAEKFCETCHNKQSPNFTGFDFKKMWVEIAHPIPR